MDDEDGAMPDDEWDDYESGPFCPHYGDPVDCNIPCEECGKPCCKCDCSPRRWP